MCGFQYFLTENNTYYIPASLHVYTLYETRISGTISPSSGGCTLGFVVVVNTMALFQKAVIVTTGISQLTSESIMTCNRDSRTS